MNSLLNQSLKVSWVKCKGGGWCTLSKLNLQSINADDSGVYLIWQPNQSGKVVRIGQGNIADRLYAHKSDSQITKWGSDLLVTWALVSENYQDGVELFLANRYDPLEGDRFPDANEIAINLPGE